MAKENDEKPKRGRWNGRAEVVANAEEIIQRRCGGERVSAIFDCLKSRKRISVAYHTFNRWVLRMEMNELKLPAVPHKFRAQGILKRADSAARRRFCSSSENGASSKPRLMVAIPFRGTVES